MIRALFRRAGLGILPLIIGATILTACAPMIPPPVLTLPVKDQEVPVILAIGPIETTKITYEGAPLNRQMERVIQQMVRDTLLRTDRFKDVVILDLDSRSPAFNSEQVLTAARSQQADVLLTGEVKDFKATVPTFMAGSQYDVTIGLQTHLYQVHTGGLVWKKATKVTVAREGSIFKRRHSLETIVRSVAVPSATAGLLPSLVEYLQTDYAASLKAAGKVIVTAHPSEVFGGAELAKIDAELAPPPTTVSEKEYAYAVIIGVEEYRDLPKVDYAKRDAEMVKQYLIKALGYPEQNIVTLLNERVTRSQIEARLEKWLPKQVAGNSDAEVFVYYGGHGAPDPNTSQAFLVPYDGDPAFLETTAYPLHRLYTSLSELPAKSVTVVMDSCFSGAGGRSIIAKGARPMMISVENPVPAAQNMVVLSAAAGNQISSALPDKRHGLFTYYFLKGLQGEADANQDGAIEVGELYAYLKPQVETAARRMNAEQSPQLLPGADLLGERAKQTVIRLKR